MVVSIDQDFDLSMHMQMVISLTETLQEALSTEKEFSYLMFSAWLIRLYLEEINQAFEREKINIS